MDQENISYHESSLEGKPEKSGMKVPDGYFEDFDAKILNRIHSEPLHEVKSLPIKEATSKGYYYRIGLSVAVAASLLWAVFTFINTTEQEVNQNLIAEVSFDEVLDYESIDDYLFAEQLSVSELESVSDFDNDYITSEEAYAYIIEENYSEYLLTETY